MSVQATKADVIGWLQRYGADALHTIENNGGYLCQACSSAETLATLYLRVMHLGPSVGRSFHGSSTCAGPWLAGGQRSCLQRERGPTTTGSCSCTHYSLGLYAALMRLPSR